MGNYHLVYPQNIIPPATSDVLSKVGFDSFSRLQVSEPYGLFESKLIYDKQDSLWEEITNGSGSSTYLPNEASCSLAVPTTSGAYSIRQSYRYFSYVPGRSHLINMTGNFNGPVANVTKRIGYFDDNNGMFFECTSDGLFAVIRLAGNDTRIARSQFNIDRLDGTGPSGVTIDLSKAQIFTISFQWLGVGTTSFGFSFNGKKYLCHQEHHSNMVSSVYTQTPTLPARYEIRNTATSAGSSLKQICTSISTEGGYQSPGNVFEADSGISYRSVGTTEIPVMAIRLTNSFQTKQNRKTIRLNDFGGFALSGNIILKLYHCVNPSGITATWSNVDSTYSAVEKSLDISAISAAIKIPISSTFVASGQAGKGGASGNTTDILSAQAFISQNYASNNSQIFLLTAQALSGTTNIYTSMTWTEFQ